MRLQEVADEAFDDWESNKMVVLAQLLAHIVASDDPARDLEDVIAKLRNGLAAYPKILNERSN